MYDWIIEADIYRLNRAASEASTAEERRKLEGLADGKVQVLAAKQRERSVLSGSRSGGGPELSFPPPAGGAEPC